MTSAAHNAYLNTRVAARATQLMQREDLHRLAQMNLPELAAEFGLASLLDEAIQPAAKSRAVEQALIQTMLTDLAVLVRPMTAAERNLVVAWARKYALFNLKTLLRGKIRHIDPKEIRANLYDLPPLVRLSNEDLFKTESAVELLRALETGPLSLLARQTREIYEKRQEAFVLEAAIDQRYFADLARRVKDLDTLAGNRELRLLVGSLVDRANILWLLRFRFAYMLSPSEAFYQLVPSPHLMYRERLLDLVSLDEQTKVLQALPEPLRGLLLDAPNLMEIQRRLGVYCNKIALNLLRHGHTGVVRALAYLILREDDLRVIFTLMQAQLLHLPQRYLEMALGLSPAVCVHRWRDAA